MSFRYWLHNFAIGNGLIIAVILLLFWSSHYKGDQQHGDSPSNRSQQQAARDAAAVSGERSWYHPACAEKQEDKDADLCQQIRQAKAAEDAAWYARMQIGLGFAGALLVLVTIHYAKKAAAAARDAADHADAGAKAAIDSAKSDREANRFMRENAERELRPWLKWALHSQIVLRKGAGNKIYVSVTSDFQNIGKTPAVSVQCAVRLFTTDTTEPVVNVGIGILNKFAADYRASPYSMFGILPTEKMPLGAGDTISIEDLRMDKKGKISLFLAFHTAYRTETGTIAELGTVYMLHPQRPLPAGAVERVGVTRPPDKNPLTLEDFDGGKAAFMVAMELPGGRRMT